MPETGDAPNDDSGRQVDELLRINAELAAEIRSLRAGHATAPRSAAMPAARRVGALREERDSLRADLDRVKVERDESNRRAERLDEHNQELGRQIHEQDRELEGLRSGLGGLFLRVRARLRRGRAGT